MTVPAPLEGVETIARKLQLLSAPSQGDVLGGTNYAFLIGSPVVISIVPDAVLPPAKAFPAAIGGPICCCESRLVSLRSHRTGVITTERPREVYISPGCIAASVKVY